MTLYVLLFLPLLLAAPLWAAESPGYRPAGSPGYRPAGSPDFGAAAVPVPACAGPDAAAIAAHGPYDLPALIDMALCRDPLTRGAWAGVRAAEARAAQVRAAYGPQLDATLGVDGAVSRRWGGGFASGTDSSATASAGLSLGWLLYDFGGRAARLDAADAARAAALAAFADQAQASVLTVGVAWADLLAALAGEEAARENLRFAEASLAAATAREKAGVAIRSERLQADAAAAQAQFLLRQAEGTLLVARGRLASALRLPPNVRLALKPPGPVESAAVLQQSADALMDAAAGLRPDLALGRANLRVAAANVAAAQAARRPSLSLNARPGLSVGTTGPDVASASAGVTLAIPLGNGGGRTAVIAEARAEAERADANLAASEQSAALDVWTRYQGLATDAANLETARRGLRSAEEAAALSQGRYRAGLAEITELLNAQSALAQARQQMVSAELGVRQSELLLARAVGQMGEAVQ